MKILKNGFNFDKFFSKKWMGSLLMLDYDGTLAPFVEDRSKAYPYPGVYERLISLSESTKGRTIIISGRSISDLETFLRIPQGLELWGSHGLERKLKSGEKINAQMDEDLLMGLEQGIKACRETVEEKYCEIKPYAVALHWRGMAQNEQIKAQKAVESVWKGICSSAFSKLNYGLEIHQFDGGLELRPKGWNKGNVIQTILEEVSERTLIAYLGDDATDEEAFAALGERGLKVLVRNQFRPTLADIQIVPPEELLAFLDLWIKGGPNGNK